VRRTLLALALLALALAVGAIALLLWQRPPPPQHAQYLIFGSTTTVELRSVDAEQATPALAAIGQLLQQDQREWHPWEISDLMRLNAALAQGGSYRAPPGLAGLIRRSQEAYRLSDGLFDPALGALIGLWGFHTSEYPISAPMPDASQVQVLLANKPGMDDIDVATDGTVSARRSGIELDLNGLAEGYASEQIAALLRQHHIGNALINLGGDVLALGRADERPWRVGIEAPDHRVLAAVDLSGHEALFSSGDYNKYREVDGQRWGHILDPRTGQPEHGSAATSVIHPDAVVADAAATALMIAGRQDFARIARSMGVSCALLLTDTGDLIVTPAMQRRLQFPDPPQHLSVSEDLGVDCATLAVKPPR
jgi:thiamine biosynthesis lipoprotein